MKCSCAVFTSSCVSNCIFFLVRSSKACGREEGKEGKEDEEEEVHDNEGKDEEVEEKEEKEDEELENVGDVSMMGVASD